MKYERSILAAKVKVMKYERSILVARDEVTVKKPGKLALSNKSHPRSLG